MSQNQKRKLAQREANRLKRRMIEKVLGKQTDHFAPNLNHLVDGWLELESDPATFSLLIEDFGCFGAQVEEIYDLDQKFEGPIFGFIFLFKWLNNHHSVISGGSGRRNYSKVSDHYNNNETNELSDPEWTYVKDEETLNKMFFARQMISNSCATHALISVLLNCAHRELKLGPTLAKLKDYTRVMDPECRGYAIGNLPQIAKAHNSNANFSSIYNRSTIPESSYTISGNQRTNSQKNYEAYHFVSYVPIKNKLYELDGLKNFPIDHGPFDPQKDWTEKFKKVIKQRLANRSNDIRYNLMAVVPGKRSCLNSEIGLLKHQRDLITKSMEAKPLSVDDIPNPPYSPLSNATLTASESGSPPHTSDSDDFASGYFFIKFNKEESAYSKEDNMEPAHLKKIEGDVPENNTEKKYNLSKEPPFEFNILDNMQHVHLDKLRYKDLTSLSDRLEVKIAFLKTQLNEEIDKRRKYKVDNSRRTHNYEPFIMTFLSLLASHGKLADLVERDLGITPEDPRSSPNVVAKPKAKYVSTGRPVGRPRKNPPTIPSSPSNKPTIA